MIDKPYVLTMAAYNRWQNDNLYGCAGKLDDDARRRDRGAFFGSIHATLNHILWADRVWMSRFADSPPPHGSIRDSTAQHEDWDVLCAERRAFDQTIIDWAEQLDPAWLRTDFTWVSGALKREVTRHTGLLVTHFFNHQTHHRGQVHALLTAAGQRPSDTDLAFMDAGRS